MREEPTNYLCPQRLYRGTISLPWMINTFRRREARYELVVWRTNGTDFLARRTDSWLDCGIGSWHLVVDPLFKAVGLLFAQWMATPDSRICCHTARHVGP